MPKVPIDYSNTIIYKIVCKDIEIKECYVGQTTNFSQRKTDHKKKCCNINNKSFNQNNYKFIRENGGWNNWDMIEVEKYNATDKLDAHKRERYWIETLGAKLNKQIPTRTAQEYYHQNLDKIKLYYQQNQEETSEYQKIYRETHTDKIKEYKKLYREQNKEQILEKQKNYYEQNREQIILKNREKYNQSKDEINAKRRLYREKNKDKINAQHRLFILKKKEAQA